MVSPAKFDLIVWWLQPHDHPRMRSAAFSTPSSAMKDDAGLLRDAEYIYYIFDVRHSFIHLTHRRCQHSITNMGRAVDSVATIQWQGGALDDMGQSIELCAWCTHLVIWSIKFQINITANCWPTHGRQATLLHQILHCLLCNLNFR